MQQELTTLQTQAKEELAAINTNGQLEEFSHPLSWPKRSVFPP